MSRRFVQSVKLIVLIIGAFVMMFPFVWMLATSLKTLPESVAIPPILLPDTPQWSNYAEALRTAPFGLYFRNSILVAGLGTLLTLILTVLAAYAFTIYEFRGKTGSPHVPSTMIGVALHRSTFSIMRPPNTPFRHTTTLSPGATMLTKQLSMPTEPGPEIG